MPAQRRAAALLGLERVVVLVHEPELEGRGRAEDALGLGRVLHARELDDDPVQTLALNDRLGDAQRVSHHDILLGLGRICAVTIFVYFFLN